MDQGSWGNEYTGGKRENEKGNEENGLHDECENNNVENEKKQKEKSCWSVQCGRGMGIIHVSENDWSWMHVGIWNTNNGGKEEREKKEKEF